MTTARSRRNSYAPLIVATVILLAVAIAAFWGARADTSSRPQGHGRIGTAIECHRTPRARRAVCRTLGDHGPIVTIQPTGPRMIYGAVA